ncbi:hypothetical protein [Flavobacterium sp. N2038]|uniref:hypothetical protein n=1 Tax=Flavobacterium sp. N2038 TaxID=2986829 RepID=UPI00222595D8|nr:hypothetical protein [Flavobacterium sp. N2038]
MKLELPCWTSHHNLLLYSFLFFCYENDFAFNVVFNNRLATGGGIIYLDDDKTIFLDYSDDIKFIDDPKRYSFYFKRSLTFENYSGNIYPLNFQVNYSYKAINLLMKFKLNDLMNSRNRIEIIRAMDYFNLFTNLSHNAMDARSFPTSVTDNNGKIIFHTRLWNPENHIDLEEKKRREIQNQFRIEACRIIKRNFENSSVGIFPDELSARIAPDLLLNVKRISKKEYFKSLRNADIGIADDGLKDTPGWKIGECLLFGKAVITTPLNVVVEDFKEYVNYEKLSARDSYLELPEKIESLIVGKRYCEMGQKNLEWSENFLHPKNYFKRILAITKSKTC